MAECDCHTGRVVLTSRLGSSPIFESPLHSHVGADAVLEVPVASRMGVGPAGPTGPQGPMGPQGPEGGTPIVVVESADWPPAAPVEGTLYLKGE